MPERLSVSELRALQTKRPKYRNVKVTVDGMTFDSKAEAARWPVLQERERRGEIEELHRQVRIKLAIHETKLLSESRRTICLVADFHYIEDGREVIEDVKGFVTDTAALKAAIARAMGYDVRFLRWSRGQGWQRIKAVRSQRRRGRS